LPHARFGRAGSTLLLVASGADDTARGLGLPEADEAALHGIASALHRHARGLPGPLAPLAQLLVATRHDDAFAQRCREVGTALARAEVPAHDAVAHLDAIRGVLRSGAPHAADAIDSLFRIVSASLLQGFEDHWRAQLQRRERLAMIGQLSAAVGHDIRNPLGVIESSLFILRGRIRNDAGATKHLDKIARQIAVCEQIVTDLLDMARDHPPRFATIDVMEAMRGAVEEAELPDVYRVSIDVEDGLAFQADPGLLRRALVNLIANSVRALGPEGGSIALHGASLDADHVRITVMDDGPGFDASVLDIAFEPLVTTRETGVGLGLSLVRSIVLRHRGRALASNRPQRGARVDLDLPRRHDPADG
jgi:two-component system sensor histidine kinase HydH